MSHLSNKLCQILWNQYSLLGKNIIELVLCMWLVSCVCMHVHARLCVCVLKTVQLGHSSSTDINSSLTPVRVSDIGKCKVFQIDANIYYDIKKPLVLFQQILKMRTVQMRTANFFLVIKQLRISNNRCSLSFPRKKILSI